MTEEKEYRETEATEGMELQETDERADVSEEQVAEPSAEEKLEQAEQQIAQLKDQLLRKMAEFENYRKRTLKEKTDLILNGGEKVLSSLLPVLDDLERAQENMEKSDEVDTLREGVELILSKLTKTLASQGLKRMVTDNVVFDTDYHEAVAMVPVPEADRKNRIMDCVQPGYMLNEKVLRHAKVVVGQ